MKNWKTATKPERLRYAMTIANLKQVDLVSRVGVTKGLISQWLNNPDITPGGNNIAKLCFALGINQAWYLTGKEPMQAGLLGDPANLKTQDLSLSVSDNEVLINQYDTGGSMGNGGLVLKDQPGLIESFKVTKEWAKQNIRSVSSLSKLAIVTGFGDSMRPMYNPGDPLLVDTGITDLDFDGVYFFRIDGEGFVKRLQRIPGQGIMAISDNKDYVPWTITPDMDFQILGRIVKAWKGEDF